MQELIERLEKATGPDRELDADIWLEIHTPAAVAVDHGFQSPIPYTKSLDAARALIPDGWAWFVEDVQVPKLKAAARSWIPAQRTQNLPCESFHCEAASPEIALCLAALKARRPQDRR